MPDPANSRGRTLKLYLVDGSPSAVISAELGNWSGKVLVASRSVLPDLIGRPETDQTGVYLLTGPDPASSNRTLVHVGESDTIKKRLISHDGDESKQFFTRICVIVSKDENLTKAHGRYLESRLLVLIKGAARARAVNGIQPQFRGLPEPEIADMEGFLSEIEVLLPVLGFDLLREGADPEPSRNVESGKRPTFLLAQAGISARKRGWRRVRRPSRLESPREGNQDVSRRPRDFTPGACRGSRASPGTRRRVLSV